MQLEQMRQVLGSAAENVLETMFFTMIEGELDPQAMPEGAMVRAALSFTGEWSGRFEVQISSGSARTIAESFAGAMDPGDLADDKVGEVVCELTNMVCGTALSRLGSGQIFDLGTPRLLAESVPPSPAPAATGCTAVRNFDLGDGAIFLDLTIEAP